MACTGRTKAIVKILTPQPDKLTFSSPPIEVEILERSPQWQLNYYYEFDNGSYYQGYSYYALAWGEENEIGLRLEVVEDIWKIWVKGRYPKEDSLLGPVVEVITESNEQNGRVIRNFQIGSRNIAVSNQWKLIISDISGPVVERFYEQEPTYEIICGCKVDECEIPCASKSEGFCCLEKAGLLRLQRRLFDTEGGYYLR
ncbi:MAG: hypothetical protein VKJ46_15970 [Leptolyngbyaceae bacterium]|nr:hypothetical protein [Leptolyngbyaceae bacterium]